jgi:toxin HigB-1
MIASFGNSLAKDLVEERTTKHSKKFPKELHRIARKKLLMIHVAKNLIDLKVPPGNRLEKLKGDLRGYCSIRINEKWRVVFLFENGNAINVSVEDYHK